MERHGARHLDFGAREGTGTIPHGNTTLATSPRNSEHFLGASTEFIVTAGRRRLISHQAGGFNNRQIEINDPWLILGRFSIQSKNPGPPIALTHHPLSSKLDLSRVGKGLERDSKGSFQRGKVNHEKDFDGDRVDCSTELLLSGQEPGAAD
jgi:hypothetical protein